MEGGIWDFLERRDNAMKRSMCAIVAVAMWVPWAISANQDLISKQTDDNQWVMPGKNYAATRYSGLSQITSNNVRNLKQVWSFSNGAQRGHEGQPRVVGSAMLG